MECANWLDLIQKLSSQLAEVESRELRHVEQALERMRDGGYGLCERCSLKIPVARLNALPYATSCIDCQRENERVGQNRGLDGETQRWAKVFDKSSDESEGDAHINLSDFEMDMSESGR